MMNPRYTLCLATLNPAQIAAAKSALGQRRKITHALLCGPFGKLFGTETQCRKYFAAWSIDFPEIFDNSIESTNCELEDYKETRDLVLHLLHESNLRSDRTSILKELLSEDIPLSSTVKPQSFFDRALKMLGIGR